MKRADLGDGIPDLWPDDGGRLIREDMERAIYNYTMATLGNSNALSNTAWPIKLTRRMRLRLWWRSLRYDIGHRIVGYECDEGL